MSSPRFEVGEDVILQHPTHPHLNGEYVVVSLMDGESFNRSHHVWFCNGNYAYDLGIVLSHSRIVGETCNYVGENQIRKKHTPSSDSYDQMMSKLKQPVKA